MTEAKRNNERSGNDPIFDTELASGIAAFETKNFGLAMQILSPLADAGQAEAMYRVAIIHQNGLGRMQNKRLALRMMQGAAAQGHAFAMHGLGFMHYQGECVDQQDYVEAIRWFEKAAERGLPGAMMTLGMMAEAGQGMAPNPELAQQWYQKATEASE